EGFNGSL
nr:180K exoantigen - malaria parasite (Plasmodium falciparum) (fragments) [Plasmodium falciparum]